LNPEKATEIEARAAFYHMKVVGRIAFDPVFTKAMVQGETLPEYAPQADATRQVKEIWQQIITSEAMIH